MSDEPVGGLQFDRADYDVASKASAPCAACGRTIWSVYYAANGRVICESCKTAFDLAANQGSPVGRFARATVYGVGAGAAGSAIWYAVRAATGYEVGIIAIAVGFLVGAAVRKGSNGRGGWRYQALAMFLTYASIVSASIPEIVRELRKMAQAEPKVAASPAPVTASSSPAPVSSGRSVMGLGVALILLFALAFVAPFLGGAENLLGIVIIGIGVYEAWKINKRRVIEITGPHPVGTAAHG